MTADRTPGALTGAVALLERAVGYALGSLALVRPGTLANRTPCRQWDLRELLLHTDDSLAALAEAAAAGRVGLAPVAGGRRAGPGGPAGADPGPGRGDGVRDPVDAVRLRATRMIGAWVNGRGPGAVAVGRLALTSEVVAATGAVEVAVHGWDVARACGQDRPVPPALAGELLDLCRLLVGAARRPAEFGPPVATSPSASPSDRLVAFLGRRPR